MAVELDLPVVGGDAGTWGTKVNANFTALQGGVNAAESAAAAADTKATAASAAAAAADSKATTAQASATSAQSAANDAVAAASTAASAAASADSKATTASASAADAVAVANAARPKAVRATFPVEHNGTAWEYANYAAAVAAGLQPGDTLVFIGLATPPAWASTHGRVAVWTQGG